MDSTRIKSIRAGNRTAVTKFFKKLDELNTDSEMDIDIAGPIIDAIVRKQSVILKLDEQILENTSEEDKSVEISRLLNNNGISPQTDSLHISSGNNLQRTKIGDIVQIHDDSPRTVWNIGIIEDLVLGRDGLVRSAVVRSKFGLTNRPIVKLYALVINSKDNDESQILRRSVRLQNRNQRL
ncbi:unnamed protein product [Mytilus coruscus]|uniref:DUF5641 domain-containing protein n=1 Tax=Mytilus coruscus TaxID=42192 RepID=A0A6J8CPR0_MYTCO|nr:unnamed protein product [Mytilus coruscus]